MLKSKKVNPPTAPVKYPVGSFVETEAGYFYISSPTKRLHITSKRILDSWSPPALLKSTEAACAKFRVSAKMKFRNGSLIWNIADGRIYVIEGGKRRHVVSPEALEVLGAKRSRSSRIMEVSLDEVNIHEEGPVFG